MSCTNKFNELCMKDDLKEMQSFYDKNSDNINMFNFKTYAFRFACEWDV